MYLFMWVKITTVAKLNLFPNKFVGPPTQPLSIPGIDESEINSTYFDEFHSVILKGLVQGQVLERRLLERGEEHLRVGVRLEKLQKRFHPDLSKKIFLLFQ